MYYRLKEPWAFRGWKETPCAIQAQDGPRKLERPHFLMKEPFLDLLYCNGEEEVDLSDFCTEAQRVVKELLADGEMESSNLPMTPLKEWQRYRIHPSRYIESVHWSITGKCNMNCRHCLISAPSSTLPQLPLEDCRKIIAELEACGVKRVDITGGEPLVRKDFEEIVKELDKAGISIGVLFTNASLLTEETIQMLSDFHQYPNIQISFDGLGCHDWLRGVSGVEKQVDAALRILQRYKIPVSAAMCIHRNNQDSLKATAVYLAGLGVRALRVNAPQKIGIWKEHAEEYALKEDEVWEIYRAFIGEYFSAGAPLDIELDGYFQCEKGSSDYKIPYVHNAKPDCDWSKLPYCESMQFNLHISPEGFVLPCMGFADSAMKKRCPNVLDTPLAEITLKGFYHNLVDTKVSDLLAKNPECVLCPHLPACCGGCMLQDITDTGDYLVPDSRCCYFHRHIGKEAVKEVADSAIQNSPVPLKSTFN